MNLSSYGEIPIKSFCVAVFIHKIVDGRAKYLILKRSGSTLTDSWQMVSGKIERDEKPVEAVIREIKEETDLIPVELYSTNIVDSFYDINLNCINLVPIFLAKVESDVVVTLNPKEHSEYKWIGIEEARDYLVFDNHIEALEKIEARFIRSTPNRFLRITLG